MSVVRYSIGSLSKHQIHFVSVGMSAGTTVCVEIQHAFMHTLDVVVYTQQKHLCSWIYSSCLCTNNFNLIG